MAAIEATKNGGKNWGACLQLADRLFPDLRSSRRSMACSVLSCRNQFERGALMYGALMYKELTCRQLTGAALAFALGDGEHVDVDHHKENEHARC
jgi:hypothetical protein